jgi:hypothetical protein
MCAPMMIMAGLTLAGAAVSAAGAIQAGKAQAAQADYNARVAEINARTAQNTAMAKADAQEDQYESLAAKQRVAALKSGLNPDAGSAALVINQETPRNQWLDMHNTLWEGKVEGMGLENRAKGFKLEGANAKSASYWQAGSSIMGGLSGAYGAANRLPTKIA